MTRPHTQYSPMINSAVKTRRHPALTLCLDGASLSLSGLCDYLSTPPGEARVRADADCLAHLGASREALARVLDGGGIVYGVNTLFGGLADRSVKVEDLPALQAHLIAAHQAGAGRELPPEDVTVAMILRVNSLLRGLSGVREVLIQRYLDLINHNATPRVKEFGSIGASGDLIPLSAIAGAALGISDAFYLRHQGEYQPAPAVLEKLQLAPIALAAKEGLALINGTSMLTALAARNVLMSRGMFNLHLCVNALIAQVLHVDVRAFDAFVHLAKPHPGQLWVAAQLREHLLGASLVRAAVALEGESATGALAQDRYSIRCMPQFLGPIVESLGLIANQVTIEMNAATDNPLIDPASGCVFHCGNFLGQHMSMAMDQLRVNIALLAKHSEAQIALLVEPHFSGGLPASLADPGAAGVGLKPLQLLGNSLLPVLEQLASPLAVRFPVHAEQFNQNINSQGFAAAWQTRNAIEIWRRHLAVSVIFAVQAALLRCAQRRLAWRQVLSSSGVKLVEDVAALLAPDGGGELYSLSVIEPSFDAAVATVVDAIEAEELRAMGQGLQAELRF